MTEASRVQALLTEQNAEIDRLKSRIEKLETTLRWICGSKTIEYFDGTYEISREKILGTYRKVAKEALEGKDD